MGKVKNLYWDEITSENHDECTPPWFREDAVRAVETPTGVQRQLDEMWQRIVVTRSQADKDRAYDILSKPCPEGCDKESWLEAVIDLAKVYLNDERYLQENAR